MKSGTALRRFQSHGKRIAMSVLDPSHGAASEGRTRYPARVIDAEDATRILKSGHHNRKIGAEVQKGKWKGMPIYTLTLEERATCPSSCLHWLDCYGNKMGWAPRHNPGLALETKLTLEVDELSTRHAGGFVVRLHVLGDFYDVHYAVFWAGLVRKFEALHVYGYTAHPIDSEIGRFILHARDLLDGRFAIRHSEHDGEEWCAGSTLTDGIVCPAQTEKTECCATCALCWQTSKNIVFIAH